MRIRHRYIIAFSRNVKTKAGARGSCHTGRCGGLYRRDSSKARAYLIHNSATANEDSQPIQNDIPNVSCTLAPISAKSIIPTILIFATPRAMENMRIIHSRCRVTSPRRIATKALTRAMRKKASAMKAADAAAKPPYGNSGMNTSAEMPTGSATRTRTRPDHR